MNLFFKKNTIITLIFALVINVFCFSSFMNTHVNAKENQTKVSNELRLIDEADGYEYYVGTDSNQKPIIYTYKNNELLYKSYFKDDGNLYTLIQGKEIISLFMIEENNFRSYNNIMSTLRAPSEFIFPSEHSVGTYYWKDNPALGVAPYVCKMASQTYPKVG